MQRDYNNEEDLRKMISDGMTTKQMADEAHVSYQTMYSRLSRMGITNPNRSKHKNKSIRIQKKKKEWYEGKSREQILRHYERLGYHIMTREELLECLKKDEQMKDIDRELDELK